MRQVACPKCGCLTTCVEDACDECGEYSHIGPSFHGELDVDVGEVATGGNFIPLTSLFELLGDFVQLSW